jgi:hypothetical protein
MDPFSRLRPLTPETIQITLLQRHLQHVVLLGEVDSHRLPPFPCKPLLQKGLRKLVFLEPLGIGLGVCFLGLGTTCPEHNN